MKPHLNEETLRHLLADAPHIADDGFTDRVMARIPARRKATAPRAALVLGFALAAFAIVSFFTPLPAAVTEGWREVLASEIGWTPSFVALLLTACAALGTGILTAWQTDS